MPRGAALGPAILIVLAGLGVAAAFAPAWDSYTLRTATGQTQYLTAGDAFANPAAVIVGDVAVMVALAAVVIAAAAWRPVRHGAILLAGAIIPMAAQAISALVQAGEATSPQQFGLTPAQAAAIGLTIDNGLTPAFWIYCVLLVTLAVSCLWMFFTPATTLPATTVPVTALPATTLPAPAPAGDVPGDVPPATPAQSAAAERDASGWNPTWYVATPDASGVSSPEAPVPAAADTPPEATGHQPGATGHQGAEHDQAT
jgi:hypothetical protein